MKNHISNFGKISLALFICFTVYNCVFAAKKTEIIKIADIPYGTAGIIDMTLDLYFPAKTEKKMPLAVWIHGGGWRKGSKNRCPIKWLINEGYAVASISYRLTDVATFPAQIHDCKGAIRWLRANADILGIDSDKIAVIGHSAGGQLATLLGTSSGDKYVEGAAGGNSDVSSQVQAVVCIAGATDFILRAKTQPKRTEQLARNYFGGSPKEMSEKAKKASSAFYVGKNDSPTIILHGADDKMVPLSQSTSFHEKYQKAGLRSKLIIVDGAGHNDLKLLLSEKNRKTIVNFLNKTFDDYALKRTPGNKIEKLCLENIPDKKRFLKVLPQIRCKAEKLPVPTMFKNIPSDSIRMFIPRQHYRKGKRIIKDKDSDSAYTAQVHNPDKPFSFGFVQNDKASRKGVFTLKRNIANKDITLGKYKIYRLGKITISPDCQIWFSSKSWQTRIQLGSRLFEPSENNQWEAYASLKFDGPAYGGEKTTKNTVFCDKLILVKKDIVDKNRTKNLNKN